MANDMLINALKITKGYLDQNYSTDELNIINKEIDAIAGKSTVIDDLADKPYSYEELQDLLSTLNEKETIRKNKGVYYTPADVVNFILTNSVKMACGKLEPNNLHVLDLKKIPYTTFCYKKTVYDPTCGSGVFLLAALKLKMDLLDLHHANVTKGKIQKVVKTIKGNDLNGDSITITKIRLFLCVLQRYGAAKVKGLSEILNSCYECYDYVENKPRVENKYDIIIGNPPYVEDAKSASNPETKYGNIYANMLENASLQLNTGGVLGFVIPLSYVSTPRMKEIRSKLYAAVPEQYILSYSDRPDCLFASVHQKLCILLGRNKNGAGNIYTGNYRYWYKEERQDLFDTAEVVKNNYVKDEYIPKLGAKQDVSIYKKLIKLDTPIIDLLERDGEPLYLNMRAAFWIKAFLNEHTGAEYKTFKCENRDYANFCMCLLNSSLFWWYWICVSDCWHITRKELLGFKTPKIKDFTETNRLAVALENQLEDTKLYVGTKQTKYEYKHKECIDIIHQIDDYVNTLYGLTEEEGIYIKNFAYRYRISGGVEMNVIDLFSGCGGLSLGFAEDGYNIKMAVEIDANIAETYKMNYPEADVIVDDIKNIDQSGMFKAKDADVIIGGPPCQGFSMAGARIRNGFIDDPRNYLFKHYFNVVKTVKPKAFVMENVKGMLTMQGGKIFEEILRIFSSPEMLDGSPYKLNYRVVNAAEFGVPQRRERLIIIGTQVFDFDFDEVWEQTKREILTEYPHYFDAVTVEDAIGNLTKTTDDGNIKNPKPITEYQKYLAADCDELSNHTKTNHSRVAVDRMSRVANGENFTSLKETINSVHSGSYGRLCWDDQAPTITTRFDTPAGGRFIHPEENRTLSPREAARIQSFPDDFVFCGNKTSICKQIGNAVPPKVSYFLARLVSKIIKSEV